MSALGEAFKIAIPCDLVPVEAQVGAEGGLTTLEQALTTSVLAGHDTIEQLESFLCITRRMTLDVVHDLWSQGHLLIDFGSGRVGLSDEARRALKDDSLDSGTVQRTTWEFLHEPITGEVLTAFAAQRHIERDLPKLPRAELNSVNQIEESKLLRAVQTEIDRRSPAELNLYRRVLSVSRGSVSAGITSESRWLSIEIATRRDEAGRTRVQLVCDTLKTASARRRLERHIEELCDDEPGNEFANHLQGSAAYVVGPTAPVDDLLDRLARRIEVAAGAEPRHFEQARRELLDTDASTRNALRGEDMYRAKPTLMTGRTGIEWATRELVQSAEELVVIATSKIGYGALQGLRELLESALARHVRIVLLWGRAHNDVLEKRVRLALSELLYSFGDRLLFSTRPSRLRGAFVTQDTARALVSTNSSLESRTRSGELGVLIEAVDGLAAPLVIDDLLRSARRNFPEYALATTIRASVPWEEGPADGYEPPRQLLDMPDTDDRDAVVAWVEGWRTLLAARRRAAARLRQQSSARLVEDGEHFSALLGTSKESDVPTIASPNPGGHALTGELRDRLASVTSGALRILTPSSDEVRPWLAGSDLSVDLIDSPPVGPLAIADDTVVLGSFDYLGDRLDKRRKWMSVAVTSPRFSNEIRRHLDLDAVSNDQMDDPERADDMEAIDARVEAAVALVDVSAVADQRARRARLDDLLGEHPDPFGLIDEWHSRGAARDTLRSAVAAALPGPTVNEDVRARWEQWLVDDAIARRCFVEAAMAATLSQFPTEPPVGVLYTAMPLERAWLEEQATDVVVDLLPTDETVLTAMAGLLYEVLFHPTIHAAEALDYLADTAAEFGATPWLALAAEALAYRQETGGAVPIDRITGAIDRSLARDELDARWRSIGDEIDRLRSLSMKVSIRGNETVQAALFRKGGPMSLIGGAAGGSSTARTDLLEEIPDDIRQWIDEEIHRRGLPDLSSRRRGWLRKISDVHRAARVASTDESEFGGRGAETDVALDHARTLGRRFREIHDGLLAESTLAQPNHGRIRLACLQLLEPISSWTEVR